MILIGISAKAGCGKTTMADCLVENFGFTRAAFGDGVKEECADFTQLPIEYFYDAELKEKPVEVFFGTIIPRRFMQWWGTDYRRRQDSDYWVKYLRNKLANLLTRKIVVDDVRFKNEACFFKNYGGTLVRLEPYMGYTNAAGAHKSETDLDNYQGFDLRLRPEYGEILAQAVAPLITYLSDMSILTTIMEAKNAREV